MAKYSDNGEEQDNERPGKSINVLTEELKRIQGTCRHWPEAMPRDPLSAAKWWMGIVEPGKDHEAPKRHPCKVGDAHYWVTPYTDRLVRLVRLFIHAKPEAQNTIIACSEDQVYWRGDSIDFLMKGYSETMNMREEGVESYARRSFRVMRKAIAHIRAVLRG